MELVKLAAPALGQISKSKRFIMRQAAAQVKRFIRFLFAFFLRASIFHDRVSIQDDSVLPAIAYFNRFYEGLKRSVLDHGAVFQRL